MLTNTPLVNKNLIFVKPEVTKGIERQKQQIVNQLQKSKSYLGK